MPFLKSYLQNLSLRNLTLLAVILCLPAFCLNLDLIAFIGDEGLRSLVALEMKLTGDFIVPTLNGEPYYNKPPLYNWLIYFASMAFGHFGEWPARLTTLFFLACFAFTIYAFSKKLFGKLPAITLAFMTLTSGRILFWDSMLGLIDICFSWVVYMNFMILYFLGKANRWRLMFALSWLLFSFAFLLKGLPAVVFQGISLITALYFHGALKRKIFSLDHWTGAALGILPVLAYYIPYASKVELEHVFAVLFDQSMQRTGTHHGWWKTILHVFTFPFEQLYHFLPWSLLALAFFHPKFRQWIKENDFVRYNAWILFANLPVYWLSVQVYPRYLLMFIPLFNIIGFFICQKDAAGEAKFWQGMRYCFLAMAGLTTIAFAAMPLSSLVRSVPEWIIVWLGSVVFMLIGLAGIWWDEKRTFLWFAICLLVVRCVFDVVVLPIRSRDHAVNEIRDDCRRIATRYGDKTWYLYKETFPHNVARFYTSAYAGQVIRSTDDIPDLQALYLVDRNLYPDFPGDKIDSIQVEGRQYLALMQPYAR